MRVRSDGEGIGLQSDACTGTIIAKKNRRTKQTEMGVCLKYNEQQDNKKT